MPSTAAIAPADCKELSTWQVLTASAVQVPLTGTTIETTLATYSLAGGTLGPNGRLRITSLWSFNSSGGTKFCRAKLGGTTFFQYGATTQLSVQALTIVRNRNAQNSQVGMAPLIPGIGAGAAALVTAAIDTSVAQNILLTGQLSSGADNLALEGYIIEGLYGA